MLSARTRPKTSASLPAQRSRHHTVPGIPVTVLLASFIGVQVEQHLIRRQGLSDDRERIIRHKVRVTQVLRPFPSDLLRNRLGELRQRLLKRDSFYEHGFEIPIRVTPCLSVC